MSGDFGATTPHPKMPIRFRLMGGALYRNCISGPGDTNLVGEARFW
jgi:hypothetical protein